LLSGAFDTPAQATVASHGDAVLTDPIRLTPAGRSVPPRGSEKPAATTASGTVTPEAPAELSDLVTLNQAAAMVHGSKRTLERYKTRGTLPAPAVERGDGRSDLWDWRVLRPWLEETFKIPLPETYPANRRP
jgi:hypothetical protein